MSATPEVFSKPNFDAEDDFSIAQAFRIAGIVVAFLVSMVIIRFFCNTAIDVAVLRNVHVMKRYLTTIVPDFANPSLARWHPRTQEDANDISTPQESGQSELVDMNSLLCGMTKEEKYDVLSFILASKTSTKESLEATSTGSIDLPGGGPRTSGEEVPCSHSMQCPICINEITRGQKMTLTSCGHVFHLDCLCEWLGTDTTDCPNCRREILTKDMVEAARQMRNIGKQ